MSTLAALASLRAVTRQPWQAALAVLGIALGVAVVVGIDLSADSSLRGFRLAGRALAGAATHSIEALGGVPGETYARLSRELPEVGALPVVEFPALVVEPRPARGSRTLTVFGVDPISAPRLVPWLPRDAAGTSLELVAAPGTGYLSRELAEELALDTGDELVLRVESRLERVRLIGTLAPGDTDSRAAFADLLVVDVATAQELSGRPDRLSRIDLALPDGEAEAARLAAEIRARLPAGVKLGSAGELRRTTEELTRAFRQNLHALSLLALLVGAFLVYNTMTFSVRRRRGLFAALRTLGATRAQVFVIVAGEALWLGLAGSALGLALGVLLARSLLGLVAGTVNDLYFSVSVRAVHLDPALLLQSAALGVGATLVSALVPALEATRERPRLVLAASTLESARRSNAGRVALAGLAILAISAALFLWPTRELWPALAGLLALFAGSSLLAPYATVALSRLLAPLAERTLGLFGRHAARGIETHLSRTSVAIAALAVAIAATVGMGAMIASFRSTFVHWLGRAIEADVYCSAPTLVSSHNESTLAPETVARLISAPGVADWTSYRGFVTESGGERLRGAAITLNAARRDSFELLEGGGADLWERFERDDGLLASEALARKRGLSAGSRLELATDHGPRTFTVLGVHKDFTSESGVALLSRTVYERHFADRGVTSLELFLAPDGSPAAPAENPEKSGGESDAEARAEALVRELKALVPADEMVTIRSNRALREASIDVFDRTFAITGVLRWISTLVAFVGTLSALLSLELERSREIGVLRAQGVTPSEVRTLVLAETGLSGLIAGLFALPIGALVAVVLARVINVRSFGWSLDLVFDPGIFLAALAVACAASLGAGIVPAWRMSRGRPSLALRGE